MCVKFSLENLNPVPYLPHPISTYTCGVTTTPKVRGGNYTTNNTFLCPIKNNTLILREITLCPPVVFPKNILPT